MKPKTLKKKLSFKKETIAKLDQKVIKAGGGLTIISCGLPTCHLTCGTCAGTCDGATCGEVTCGPFCGTLPTCNIC